MPAPTAHPGTTADPPHRRAARRRATVPGTGLILGYGALAE